MEVENLTVTLAFMAGLVSFISPCVLPLVPAYIGYMGGRATTEADKAGRHKFATLLHGVSFVLGFTIFFVGFGLLTAAASSFLNSIGVDIPTLLTRLGGVAVIFFGLYVMKALDPIFAYALKLSGTWEKEQNQAVPLVLTVFIVVTLFAYFYWAFGAAGLQSLAWTVVLFTVVVMLFRKPINAATSLANFWNQVILSLQIALISDTRKQIEVQPSNQRGYVGSVSIGLVFAAGWTPCIGPVYGAVLTLANDAAAGAGSLAAAGVLLTAYSLGLGIPFLLTALAFNQSVSLMGRLKRNMLLIERASGVLLLVIGFLILTGGLTNISRAVSADGSVADFSFRLEACTAAVFDSRINTTSYPACVGSGFAKLKDRYIVAVSKGEENTSALSRFVFEPLPNPDAVEVGLQVGMRAPEFTLRLLDGSRVSLSDLRGQAVLVNFWATWCGPCRAEMPELEAVYLDHQARGFTLLAVDFMEDTEVIARFMNELDLELPVALDRDGDVNHEYRVRVYPTSFLIDGNGIITFVHNGPLNAQTLLQELEKFTPDSEPNNTAFQVG